MISLSTLTIDLNGCLLFPSAHIKNVYQAERRGSITATLDGGSSCYDGGYSISDQTYMAEIRHPTLLQLQTLQYMIAYYSELRLCCETGAFRVRAQFSAQGMLINLNLRLLGKLDL